MLIFDRDRPDHPWRRAFEDLSSAVEPTHRILAENWRMDPRISEDREVALLKAGECGPSPLGPEWLGARSVHFRRFICRPSEGDEIGPGSETVQAVNAVNRLEALPGYLQMVHVKCLNSVLRRLARPGFLEDDQKAQFRDLTGHTIPERSVGSPGLGEADFGARVDEIASATQSRGGDTIRELAAFLCEAPGSTQPLWWACFAEEINHLLDAKDAGGLCKALGLGHFRDREWLLIWRYDVRWTRLFHRPTVVEAGDSPYHHPSPPAARFGVTMPLDEELPACRELLHLPLGGRFASQGCTGELIQIEGLQDIADDELIELRQHHRDRLREEPVETRAEEWLDRHFTET